MSQQAAVDAAPPAKHGEGFDYHESLTALGPDGRLAAYRVGALSNRELWAWARRFPEEVPVVNGELEWIALRLADID